MAFTITSPAFENGREIPRHHTCEGDDTSPVLEWTGAPEGTRSFALIVDDPDAPDPAHPKTTWVHWVLFNLPPDLAGLPAGASRLPPESVVGENDWKRNDYGGPCPPIGRHRYFFKLYALDRMLYLTGKTNKSRLEAAMQGHVIGKTELVGTYRKAGR